MPSESADQRSLLALEADLWHAEAERTQNRLDDPQHGSSEAEQVWYDYCERKHEKLARELDKIANPQKYSAGNVAKHESLDGRPSTNERH